jgi:hypothetical protein
MAIFAALAGWLARPLVAGATDQKVAVVFPGGMKLNVETRKEGTDYGALLAQLFGDEFARLGTTAWLREKQRLYSTDSPELADLLNRQICDPIPEHPVDQRITKARECAEKPLVGSLRRLAQSRAVPFHYVGVEVQAGVQISPPHRPGGGRVNVCRTGPFVGQRLQVIDPRTSVKVDVDAGGLYDCTIGEYPAIQLDPEDAGKLFGRPLAKLEKVIVVIL